MKLDRRIVPVAFMVSSDHRIKAAGRKVNRKYRKGPVGCMVSSDHRIELVGCRVVKYRI